MIANLVLIFLFTILLTIRQSLSDVSGDQRIVNGWLAKEQQFPYQVALFKTHSLIFHCGGSILNKNFVLTAAHCVVGFKPEEFSVVYGTINYRNGPREYVKQIIVHEKYKNSSNTRENDIALLKLEHSLTFDEHTKPISLRKTEVPVGTRVKISGYGTPSTGELRYIETYVKECDKKQVGVICLYKDKSHGACDGDSGGPAIYDNELIGAYSLGSTKCNKTYSSEYDRYTSVAYFFKWINEKIGSKKEEYQ